MYEIVSLNCYYRIPYPARRVRRNKSVLGPRGNNDYTANASCVLPVFQRVVLKLGQLELDSATKVIGIGGLLHFTHRSTMPANLQQQVGHADQEAIVLLPSGAPMFDDRLDD